MLLMAMMIKVVCCAAIANLTSAGTPARALKELALVQKRAVAILSATDLATGEAAMASGLPKPGLGEPCVVADQGSPVECLKVADMPEGVEKNRLMPNSTYFTAGKGCADQNPPKCTGVVALALGVAQCTLEPFRCPYQRSDGALIVSGFEFDAYMTPTPEPTPAPSPLPTPAPSPLPTPAPSPLPTPAPSPLPTPAPSPLPTPAPSPLPTPAPSPLPTPGPTTTMGGDPHVRFNGTKINVHLPTDRFTKLFEQDGVVIRAKGGPNGSMKTNYISEITVGVDGKIVASVAQLHGSLGPHDPLLKLTVNGTTGSVGGRGQHRLASLRLDTAREKVAFSHEVSGLEFVVASRETQRRDAVDSHHLNLRLGKGLVTSGPRSAQGALPQIWGVQPLTPGVKALIRSRSSLEPAGEQRDGQEFDFSAE
eukprot:TRINITY_DN30270_c1_g1_i6.p1 TRINITY_DN30270_c1_g1~~TRINITY_DN30270_c1_g1_i6.p1  ORF type:complete len:423 (+),score=40.54 TRINITY_DN30270_c1_g1_i6:77-1345(+)